MFDRPQRAALWASLAIFAVAAPILIFVGAYLYRHDEAARRQRVTLLCEQTAVMIAQDRLDDAEDAFLDVLRIDPGNIKASDFLAQIRASKKARADALPILDRARESLRQGTERELEARKLTAQSLPTPPADAPPSLRAPGWDAEDRRDVEVRALYAQAAVDFTAGIASAEAAAALDHTWREPVALAFELNLRGRAARLMSLPEQAQEAQALQGILNLAREMKELKDQPIEALQSRLAECLPSAPGSAATGLVRVESDASEIYLFRYLERQHRLVPLPCSAAGETRSVALVNVDPLPPTCTAEQRRALAAATAYPLEADPFNLVQPPLTLQPGSYLLLLRKPGAPDVRCPIVVRAEETCSQVAVFPATTPDGFVYVPPGPCAVGRLPGPLAAPHADALPGQIVELEGFFIGRTKVTVDQYVTFLNDGPPRSPEDLARLGGHVEDGRIALANASRTDVAAVVSAEALDAFCAWYTRTYGAGEWVFTPATEFQWEKAARGVDGREHVWGNRDEPGFHSIERQGSSVTYRSDGSGLSPADESPYGVRDMTATPPEYARASATEFVVKGMFGRAYHRLDRATSQDQGCIRLVAQRVGGRDAGK